MRTIVQLSDLHFGTILEPTLEPLRTTLRDLAPDLTIISGDLTQRAKPHQFMAARTYLDRLPHPQLVIPGNHDVPLYDVLRRFGSPLGRYCQHITNDLAPSFIDEEIAVVGINTARALTFKGGRISAEQREAAAARFGAATGGQARIVVTHHPFDIPEGLSGVDVVGGAADALETFERCQVDLFLSGHIHLVHITSASKYRPGYGATILQAGTATSTRARGESNSFFVFRVDSEQIACEVHSWDPDARRFTVSGTHRFPRVSAPAVATP